MLIRVHQKLHFDGGAKGQFTTKAPAEGVHEAPDWIAEDEYFRANLLDGKIEIIAGTGPIIPVNADFTVKTGENGPLQGAETPAVTAETPTETEGKAEPSQEPVTAETADQGTEPAESVEPKKKGK